MSGEERDGVALTNLDQPLFADANATKRDLVDYLDAMSGRILPELAGRPLSVIRVLRGQDPFMQKNVPKYAPEWLQTVTVWAESARREVTYALCNDRRSLLWFANQRAVEYHPALLAAEPADWRLFLIMDLDPPSPEAFGLAVQAALLVRQALSDAGLQAAVKTSGAKGVHVFTPVAAGTSTCTPLAPLVLTAPARPRSASACRTRNAARTARPNESPAGGSMSRTRYVGQPR